MMMIIIIQSLFLQKQSDLSFHHNNQSNTVYLFSRGAPSNSTEEKVSTRNQGLNGDPQVPEEHRSSDQQIALLSRGESNVNKL